MCRSAYSVCIDYFSDCGFFKATLQRENGSITQRENGSTTLQRFGLRIRFV